MKRVLQLAFLALALAPAAHAQSEGGFVGSCMPHRGSEVRCAVAMALMNQNRLSIYLTTNGDGQISGEVQSWASVCGWGGTPWTPRRHTNAPGTFYITDHSIGGSTLTTFCAEVFIFNCRNQAGQAVSCERGFGNAQIRVLAKP